jgi:hypothetical protein
MSAIGVAEAGALVNVTAPPKPGTRGMPAGAAAPRFNAAGCAASNGA